MVSDARSPATPRATRDAGTGKASTVANGRVETRTNARRARISSASSAERGGRSGGPAGSRWRFTGASANPAGRRVTRKTRVAKQTAVVRAPLKYVEVLDTQAADDAALTRRGLAVLRVEGLSGVRLDAEVQGKKLPWFGVRTPKTVLSYAQLVCSVRSDAGLRMEGSSKNVKKRENNATHHAPSILAAVFGGHFARREQTRDGQASDPPARPRAGREDRRPHQERRRYSVARVRGVQGARRDARRF